MNKKIIILIVLVECILSIFLISFLGKSIESSITNTECQKIAFVDNLGLEYEDGKVLEIDVSNTEITYQLKWKISPDRTTDKSVTFSSSNDNSVRVSKTGLVTFIDFVPVTITITSADGSNKSANITLIPKEDMSGKIDL